VPGQDKFATFAVTKGLGGQCSLMPWMGSED